jgi:hypothetical protein
MVAGDWAGSGHAGIGAVDPLGNWYLRNSDSAGAPDLGPFPYGLPGWTPVAGGWDPGTQPLRAAGVRKAGDPAPVDPGGGQLQDAVAAERARPRAAGVGPALAQSLAPGARKAEAPDAVFATDL